MSDHYQYWRDIYGEQSQDFIKGVIAGIEAYAIWKNGQQYVGVCKEKLEDVIKQVKQELNWHKVR